MRRQARIFAGGALVVRSASALQVWLWLLIFIFQNEFRISRSIQPGYLDFDNLPETNFTCTGKVIGGYYADLETSCQMFHVCTVGQQDEPMDIKFLCLNGTVFDQETRVCERVDEVDCTKSEKFYSLNLELYGSTAPPIITVDASKPQSTEQSSPTSKPTNNAETDPSLHESPTTVQDKDSPTEVIDSTEDPIHEIKKDDSKYSQDFSTTHHTIPEQDEIDEYQDDDIEYEDDYDHPLSTTTVSAPTTTTTTTSTRPSPSSTASSSTHRPIPSSVSSPISHSMVSSIPSSLSASSVPSADPALLSPQEFIYRHRGPGSEAISFQSFRPADGVYITHAPPQQFDHFQYESSRTAPRPGPPRPSSFAQRPQPAPFRPTTLDPRDQLLRPGPTSQSSERHETSINHRPHSYLPALPAQRPLPFNPYYYERKRSDDASHDNQSSLAARSVAPPTVTERPPNKLKSPPRVIVTASASVSDSNGKRLNYTVGNVVSAVKPIVPINYDDYKESDLIFDPFFLDVPKLQKRRKTRSNKNRIFTIPSTATVDSNLVLENSIKTTLPPIPSQATTMKSFIVSSSTTTVAWNPNDYVDDNYEPHAYVPPEPPRAVLIAHDIKYKKQERPTSIRLDDTIPRDLRLSADRAEQSRLTTPTAPQTFSSQIEGGSAVGPVASPPPAEAQSCATSQSTDCRTRA